MNKREKQLRSIRDNINAAPDIHGINKVTLDLVREAVSSLEAEGQPLAILRRNCGQANSSSASGMRGAMKRRGIL